jgi:hypothetical protein
MITLIWNHCISHNYGGGKPVFEVNLTPMENNNIIAFNWLKCLSHHRHYMTPMALIPKLHPVETGFVVSIR